MDIIYPAKLLVFKMLVPGGLLGEMKHLPGNIFFTLSQAPGPNICRTLKQQMVNKVVYFD